MRRAIRRSSGISGSLYQSALNLDGFFRVMYQQYDVFGAPALESQARRLVWAPESPALQDERTQHFDVRIGLQNELASDVELDVA